MPENFGGGIFFDSHCIYDIGMNRAYVCSVTDLTFIGNMQSYKFGFLMCHIRSYNSVKIFDINDPNRTHLGTVCIFFGIFRTDARFSLVLRLFVVRNIFLFCLFTSVLCQQSVKRHCLLCLKCYKKSDAQLNMLTRFLKNKPNPTCWWRDSFPFHTEMTILTIGGGDGGQRGHVPPPP